MERPVLRSRGSQTSQNPVNHLTTRQLNRAVHAAAHTAESVATSVRWAMFGLWGITLDYSAFTKSLSQIVLRESRPGRTLTTKQQTVASLNVCDFAWLQIQTPSKHFVF
jgi:hypothetical protein